MERVGHPETGRVSSVTQPCPVSLLLGLYLQGGGEEEDTVDSGALLGVRGPHTLGHGTAQRKPRTKDAIQRGWRERREKEQRDDRETGRQTQREMENRETERKHAERNEIDGDRNAETEILRDKEEKLETNSKTERDRQGQKDEESLRWRHEGPPTSIPPGPLS